MAMDPHALALVVSTLCVGVMMAFSGMQKSVLDWKNRRRLCPSCGRRLRSGCICR
jgi:hypothetical protein